MKENNLPGSFGVKLDFELACGTYPFTRLDDAADRAGIAEKNRVEKPTGSRAFSRALNYMMKANAASIQFPANSKWAQFEVETPIMRIVKDKQVRVGSTFKTMTGRNPNFSLKFTQVKKTKGDNVSVWRINIADHNKRDENLAHVLNVSYDFQLGLVFTPGSDIMAHAEFGVDLETIVRQEFDRFLNNYDDTDLRAIVDAEITDMKALKIIKRTNCFIPRNSVDHAYRLYNFLKECGQTVSWLGLDQSDATRQSLLDDLKRAVFAEMDEFEAELDEKLNNPPTERARKDKQRERMWNTANSSVDKIMALSDYHQQCLGVLAEGIKDRERKLREKINGFLFKDFEKKPEQVEEVSQAETVVTTNADDPFASAA